jgi:hypothetical protein
MKSHLNTPLHKGPNKDKSFIRQMQKIFIFFYKQRKKQQTLQTFGKQLPIRLKECITIAKNHPTPLQKNYCGNSHIWSGC